MCFLLMRTTALATVRYRDHPNFKNNEQVARHLQLALQKQVIIMATVQYNIALAV